MNAMDWQLAAIWKDSEAWSNDIRRRRRAPVRLVQALR